MIINFTKLLVDFDGNETESYAKFAINSINAPKQGLNGEQLLDRFELAMRIKNSTEEGIEISKEEKKKLLDAIVEIYPSPIIYKRFTELFAEV